MEIIYTKEALKDIRKLPAHIRLKMAYWLDFLDEYGFQLARQYRGFHDEPLKGERVGQRSVRLSKGYRVIYRELHCEHAMLVEILEVNKHEY